MARWSRGCAKADQRRSAAGGEAPSGHTFLMTQEGIDLANLFPKIQHRRIRRRLVDLVRAMIEDDADSEAVATG